MGKLLGSILRFLFSWIDSIVIKLITILYRLLTDLSELVLYSDNIIKLIGRRIALILGIFMLFKLAISLISYMISPDKLSDSKQGGGKLIVNVFISLGLLISVNLIFKEAYKVQGIIVNSQIIEKIFFGNTGMVRSNNDYSEDSDNPTVKMDIGYYLYSGFFVPNSDEDVFGDVCNDMWDVSVDWKDKKEGQDKSCYDTLDSKLDSEMMKSLGNARNSLDMSYVFSDHDLILASPATKKFYFEYTPIVSTAAGIVVLLVLLSFAMDLATRAVKLLFLQIIAPIPIISNMDMGKGQDIFKKWGKECINTYLTVFIRLITINFAVFMIVLLKGNYKDLFVNNIWLNVFLIIGCLMFAKQVPKLLEDFFGIKMDGMALNPLKKFQEQALFGKQISGVASGLAVGGLATGAGLLTGQGIHRKIFSSAVKSGFTGEKFSKNFSNSYGAIRARHKELGLMHLDGVDRFDVAKDKAFNLTHVQTRIERINSVTDGLKAIQSDYDSYVGISTGVDAIAKDLDKRKKAAEAAGDYAEANKWSAALDARVKEIAQNNGRLMTNATRMQVNANGTYTIVGATAADYQDNDALKNIADHMTALADSMNKKGADYGIEGYKTVNYSLNPNGGIDDIKGIRNLAQGSQQSIETNSKNRELQDIAKYSGKDKK